MKYLIWDFDGTLGYRVGGWTGALIEVLRRFEPGVDITPEEIRPYIQSGYPWHAPEQSHLGIQTAAQWWDRLDPVFERAYERVGVDSARVTLLAKYVRQVFSESQYWCLFDDTLPVLGHLVSKDWTHIILSNHVPELGQIISDLGLTDIVSQIFNSAEIGYEKPHPQAFRIVLDALGRTEVVWMIGDNIKADVEGAQAVGLPAILVRKYHEDAVHFAEDLYQIEKVIDS